jgi:hypothetical protein
MQRSDVTRWTQNVHGKAVVRYRFNALPGNLDATPSDGACWIGSQEEVPPTEMPAVAAAFRTNLRLVGYTTSEPRFVPDPGTLVVGDLNDTGETRSYSVCVHGQRDALIQMSGYGIVDVTADPGILASESCVSAR